jgi:undecaprenyl-diphosphatase
MEIRFVIAEHLRRFRLLYTAAILVVAGVWAFAEIAEDYPEGRYRAFDELVLRTLRSPANPAVPRGPAWVKEMVRDVSALGSGFVLTVVVVLTSSILFLRQAARAALAIVLASLGGMLLSTFLKSFADRPRPILVPHLVEVSTTSFPSGHSLLSAAIYLIVAGILTRGAGTALKVLAFGLAGMLTAVVGFSRVYLGVHFPSDVLAGWTAGITWSFFCLSVVSRFHAGDSRRRERGRPQRGSRAAS